MTVLPLREASSTNANGPPALCEACGHLFRSPHATVIGQNISFMLCTITCERCGKRARVLDGTYNFVDGLVQIVSAPGWSIAALQRMQSILERHQGGEVSLDEALDDIGLFAPDAKTVLIEWLKNNGIDLIGIIIAVISIVLAELGAAEDHELRMRELSQTERLISLLEDKITRDTQSVANPYQDDRPVAKPQREAEQTAYYAQKPNRKARRKALSNTRPPPKPNWLR